MITFMDKMEILEANRFMEKINITQLREKRKKIEKDLGLLVEKEKIHKLDKRNPHKCFSCDMGLKFVSFSFNSPLSYEEDKKLWKSPYIQFYCCNCMILAERGTLNQMQTTLERFLKRSKPK